MGYDIPNNPSYNHQNPEIKPTLINTETSGQRRRIFRHTTGYPKERNLWDVPLWLPFLTTFNTFGASTLRIAYGTLSAS
ncbi:hypothetical protein CXB51_015764 [Gossypium anomalum]|uniref:Uncharacterized protein n=1 Tax=Gossypium anomalum TaxID=47600 RepID=A0A8J5YL70_9ROSI|nr:hypothetical protein CXB51_015764 [Gossypium anomalum]